MVAFANPLVATTFLPSTPLSTSVCGIHGASLVAPSPSSHRRALSTTRRPICAREFNYNIYQNDEDRAKRALTNFDRAVVIQKPLGLVLEEGQDGMVFVAEIDPEGNAAQSGEINEGDILVAVSATFGDEVWSTRGVGLDRVMKSIRIRSGEYITVVLESPDQLSEFKDLATKRAEFRRSEARERFGDKTVVDPVSWRSSKPAIYEDSDPAPPVIDDALKEKLKNEIAAPYEQNWILWVGATILLLVLLSVGFGVLN